MPRPGDSVKLCEALLREQLESLASSPPSAQELSRVQAGQRMALLGAILDNAAMASLLTSYHVLSGVCFVLR